MALSSHSIINHKYPLYVNPHLDTGEHDYKTNDSTARSLRPKHMLKHLRRPLNNQINILLRDGIRRRQHDDIPIRPIRDTTTREQRDAKLLPQSRGVNRRGEFLRGREGRFGGFVLDEFNLERSRLA